ncbi:MAG: hypothetical protein K0R97_3185 [Oerskovia sp.]|nr:hypothetical protein [Oerskovia sp.]
MIRAHRSGAPHRNVARCNRGALAAPGSEISACRRSSGPASAPRRIAHGVSWNLGAPNRNAPEPARRALRGHLPPTPGSEISACRRTCGPASASRRPARGVFWNLGHRPGGPPHLHSARHRCDAVAPHGLGYDVRSRPAPTMARRGSTKCRSNAGRCADCGTWANGRRSVVRRASCVMRRASGASYDFGAADDPTRRRELEAREER